MSLPGLTEMVAWCVTAAGVSAALTGVVTQVAWATGLLDRPNARSSHERPTPRGGGLAILVVLLLAVVALAVLGLSGPAHGGWLLVGLGIIAVVSGIDDVASVSPRIRLVAQLAAAVLATAAAGPARVIELGWLGSYDLGLASWGLTVLWIVGMTNAFNFMDGIDGIAGITAAVALGVLSYGLGLSGDAYGLLLTAAVAAAALGFLVWNWQPARVFMGDVGSASLGYVIAVVPLMAGEPQRRWLLPLAVVVMWPFLADTGITFLRRLGNRENVFEAHRSHFYQRLVIGGWSHATVALLYGLASLVAAAVAFAAFPPSALSTP